MAAQKKGPVGKDFPPKGPTKPSVKGEETLGKKDQEMQSPPPYEKVADYFWKDLYGKVFNSWKDLPPALKNEIFPKVGVKELKDAEIKELFTLRHENNRERFKQRLADFTKVK